MPLYLFFARVLLMTDIACRRYFSTPSRTPPYHGVRAARFSAFKMLMIYYAPARHTQRDAHASRYARHGVRAHSAFAFV